MTRCISCALISYPDAKFEDENYAKNLRQLIAISIFKKYHVHRYIKKRKRTFG